MQALHRLTDSGRHSGTSESDWNRRARVPPVLWLAFLIGVSVLRLWQCLQEPLVTADALRHVHWGAVVNAQGYGVMAKSLLSLRPDLVHVAWNQLSYNYPILSLLFDQLSAGLHASVTTYKGLLTLVEAANAYLVYRYSRSRVLAGLYWASPISIWWVSREGQFEPLQSLFILLALLLIDRTRHRTWAFVVIGLGIQVKLTALCLLPYLVAKVGSTKKLYRAAIALAVSFLPTAMVLLVANPLQLLRQSMSLQYNPYYFNIFRSEMFQADSPFAIAANQVASYGFLLVLLVYAIRNRARGHWIEVVPVLLYLGFLKSTSMAQAWYVLTLLPLLLPISHPRLRLALFTLTPMMDLVSLFKLLTTIPAESMKISSRHKIDTPK